MVILLQSLWLGKHFCAHLDDEQPENGSTMSHQAVNLPRLGALALGNRLLFKQGTWVMMDNKGDSSSTLELGWRALAKTCQYLSITACTESNLGDSSQEEPCSCSLKPCAHCTNLASMFYTQTHLGELRQSSSKQQSTRWTLQRHLVMECEWCQMT